MPLFIWSLLLFLICEIILHFSLNKLPNKFLIHTSGPINRLAQYSKSEIVPDSHIALIGDSNVYGFGRWLYDNSWSMKQPSFATHHLLHKLLNKEFIAFGYPGHGNMGSCLSTISEYNLLSDSWIWPKLKLPSQVLVFFYEGNDLENNLHELEHRGFEDLQQNFNETETKIREIIAIEEKNLADRWSFLDHSAFYNIASGIFKNYKSKWFNSDQKKYIKEVSVNNKNQSEKSIPKKASKNTALISDREIDLGSSEGPALHLSKYETDIALEISKQSFQIIKNYFNDSIVVIVYLPSSLSIYSFINDSVHPTTFCLDGKKRDTNFSHVDVIKRNNYLRRRVKSIAETLQIEFIDTTKQFKEFGKSTVLHGPRDPIHLNRNEYEKLAEILANKINF